MVVVTILNILIYIDPIRPILYPNNKQHKHENKGKHKTNNVICYNYQAFSVLNIRNSAAVSIYCEQINFARSS